MDRLTEIFVTLSIVMIFLLPCLVVAILVLFTSGAPSLYWSQRMGRAGRPFLIPKFRTMMLNTPVAPTENLDNPGQYITRLGNLLRRTSIDEMPQLYSVLKGDMSLVGPRPVLTTQKEFLERRRLAGIDSLRPRITGWAQINGRDNVTTSDEIIL